jgi:hypothetical protein
VWVVTRPHVTPPRRCDTYVNVALSPVHRCPLTGARWLAGTGDVALAGRVRVGVGGWESSTMMVSGGGNW